MKTSIMAATVGLAFFASSAQANTPVKLYGSSCKLGQICVYDSVGWKGTPRKFNCAVRDLTPLGSFSNRVSSTINRCPRKVILTGPGRSATIFAGQWVWTLGGSRKMDNRARYITVRP